MAADRRRRRRLTGGGVGSKRRWGE